MDRLQPACQVIMPFIWDASKPCSLSNGLTEFLTLKLRSAPGWDGRHRCYLTVSTAPVVCPRSPYEWSSTPKETVLQRAKNRKALTRQIQEALQRLAEGILQALQHSWLHLRRDGGRSCQLAIPCEFRSSCLRKEESDWKPTETPEDERSWELCLPDRLSPQRSMYTL